jgi:DTW domain-containing protein YfiP
MATRTRFVFLMHPKEYKEEKAGTGRLTHLCLPNSELHMGVGFDAHPAVQRLLADARNQSMLVYPGRDAVNLSTTPLPGLAPASAAEKQLVIFLLDATWSGARKMLRLSPSLQRLPRLMFTPSAPSRYVIKQQPQAGCLSTLETVHELLLVLERAGADCYPDRGQLLDVFQRLQDFQIRCASDPARGGYRRKPYGLPGDRRGPRGVSGERRLRYLKTPAPDPAAATGVAPAS